MLPRAPPVAAASSLRPFMSIATAACSVIMGPACRPPPACVEPGSVVRRSSFATRNPNETFVDWQARARKAMRGALALDRVSAERVPIAVRDPYPRPTRGTVVLLHGHGNSAFSVFARGRLSERLAAKGWWIMAPALRGFARFPLDSRPHAEYVRTLRKNSYLPSVLGDLIETIELETRHRPGPIVVVGHSLGAHLALHLAALEQRVRATILVGLFVRTACINSRAHHECQHHEPLAKELGAEDIALLIAPRALSIVWGANDEFFTDSARALRDETERRFHSVGAGSSFSTKVVPDKGHGIDADTVIDLVERLSGLAPSKE